jgi:hypothetical protein
MFLLIKYMIPRKHKKKNKKKDGKKKANTSIFFHAPQYLYTFIKTDSIKEYEFASNVE